MAGAGTIPCFRAPGLRLREDPRGLRAAGIGAGDGTPGGVRGGAPLPCRAPGVDPAPAGRERLTRLPPGMARAVVGKPASRCRGPAFLSPRGRSWRHPSG
ncbi:MAG TPA: hypothetical protein DEA73_08610 [Peptococcaceae bacterium]|nr:hypothetical protein [Peptococcaceae bacterium]